MKPVSVETKALVEVCLAIVPDSFTLVMLVSQRAKELAAGLSPCMPREDTKDAVLALKEIASGQIDLCTLRDRSVRSYQKFSFLAEDRVAQGLSAPVLVGAP